MSEEQLKAIVADFMNRLLQECNPNEAAWIVKELMAGIAFCSGAPDEKVRESIQLVAQMAIDTHAEMRRLNPPRKHPLRS